MNDLLKVILVVVAIVLVLWCAYYLSTLLVYIFIAAILSLLGRPVMRLLEKVKIGKFRIPTAIRSLIALLCFYLFIFAFFGSFLPVIAEQISNIANSDFNELSEILEGRFDYLDEQLKKYHITTGEEPISTAELVRENAVKLFGASQIGGIIGTVVGFLGNLLVALFSISFIAFFFLNEEGMIYRSLDFFVPKRFKRHFNSAAETIQQLLTRYFVGVLVQISLVFTLLSVGLFATGLSQYAMLIAFFGAVVNIIPYVGPIIGMAFGIIIALISGDVTTSAMILPTVLKVIIVFFSVQALDNIFFQPIIFSNSIKAHPLEIFLLISVAATFAGIGGMLLAIPVYTILRVIVIEASYELGILEEKPSESKV